MSSASSTEIESSPLPPVSVTASRSLPNLSLLTSDLTSDEEFDVTTEPPTSPPSSIHKWSPSPSPSVSRSPSPPSWAEERLQRTPNARRTTAEVLARRDDLDLPRDLMEELETPRGSTDSGGRSRSESPIEYRQRERGTERERDELDEDDERRSPEPENETDRLPGVFELHHLDRRQSGWSIHSAPAEFDSPEQRQQTSEDAPATPTSRTGSAHFEKGFRLPFSLYEYLQEEVLAVEIDGEEGVKSERVTNFLSIPGEVEKIILFGAVICLDSFLYTFTILPLRVVNAFYNLIYNFYNNTFTQARRRHLRLSHKVDMAKAVIGIGTLFALHRITDASKMYHSVRGQETIKLYVIFNVLEIADRLCCSFGQDLQDSLFSRQAFGRRTDGSHPHIRLMALIGLNLGYVVAHTLVLFYQLVTLNVAINSYSDALLTLLLSNQFVEIKGSVFKKFEKENLFQLTCADIVERFQLGLMLFIIALRNLIELSSTSSTSSLFSLFSLSLPSPSFALLQTIFSPAIVVLVSECFVDWLKHAFITKFNHIRPAVYGRFIDVLCKDLVIGSGRRQDQPFVDQSPSVSRRLGFAAMPLGCLVVRVIFQAFEMLSDDSHLDECAPIPTTILLGSNSQWGRKVGGWAVLGLLGCVGWACLVAFKLLIGINLRVYATSRWNQMEERVQEDRLNDRSRPRIGVTEKQQVQERESARIWDNTDMDAAGKRAGVSLTELSRYDMVKSRVW